MKRISSVLCALGASCVLGQGAQAQTVVVVNPKSSLTTITSEQVAQVYLGTSNEFRPLDLGEGTPIRTDFYKKVAEKDSAQVKAIWSRLAFTGKGKPPKEYSSSADVKKAVAEDVRAMGYVEKSAVDASVKVLLTVP